MKRAGAPSKFFAYGYTFKLLKEKRHIALYTQEKNNRVFGYEVHVMRCEGALCTPQAKSKFGSQAWSYTHKENAEGKFSELIKEVQNE